MYAHTHIFIDTNTHTSTTTTTTSKPHIHIYILLSQPMVIAPSVPPLADLLNPSVVAAMNDKCMVRYVTYATLSYFFAWWEQMKCIEVMTFYYQIRYFKNLNLNLFKYIVSVVLLWRHPCFILVLIYYILFLFVNDLSCSIHSLNTIYFILFNLFISSFFSHHSLFRPSYFFHFFILRTFFSPFSFYLSSFLLLYFFSFFFSPYSFLITPFFPSLIALQELSGTRKGRSKVLEAAGAVVNKDEIKDWDSIR